MLLGHGTNAAMEEQTNLKLCTYSKAITITAISNVELRNVKSDDCIGFTQLQKKWIQRLDNMQLKTCILLQTVKQDRLYLHVFVGSSICLLGAGYFFKWFETLF